MGPDRGHEWRSGKGWRSRTERIEAAHEILVLTSFFEAVDDLRLPFTKKDLLFAKQQALPADQSRRPAARRVCGRTRGPAR
ncbi:NACHT N-terminal helical domain 7-containing protein [Nonomuraea wenchangensis]|uniref:NACHT N-terminal Helical domain-containing protein n=1 Tax=Nonomuraea wenchangensis TaxID=568860 RepID=A0A1I0LNC8_9ACTN|nr:hypothetical protein [Nonomuraea wenchangensis]SEU42868.1 hypothetical protein SAMN05421811_120165 [Nonomuraea wenchangensis]